jgi:anti-sigma regulatory factor (Ser/Thr protein kinase)
MVQWPDQAIRSSRMLLAHASSSVADARHRLAADLQRWKVRRSTVDDAVLVLSELISNAIKHARPLASGKIAVSWDLGCEVVRIAVTDGGSNTRPTPVHPSASGLGGRGLSIVSSVAREWGVEDTAPGTTVWAVLRLTGYRPPLPRHLRR